MRAGPTFAMPAGARRTLDYAPAHRGRFADAWRAHLIPLGVTFGAVAALLASASVTVRHDSIQVDAVTGSKRVASEWPFGIRPTPKVQPSALEFRLKTMGVQWVPDWWTMNSRGYSVVGLQTYRGCSSDPPIYSAQSFLPEFAGAATDAEVHAFVDAMQSGTRAEQEAAIDAAFDIAARPMVAPKGANP